MDMGTEKIYDAETRKKGKSLTQLNHFRSHNSQNTSSSVMTHGLFMTSPSRASSVPGTMDARESPPPPPPPHTHTHRRKPTESRLGRGLGRRSILRRSKGIGRKP